MKCCGNCQHWNRPYDKRHPVLSRFRQCDKANDDEEYHLNAMQLGEKKFFASCISEGIAGELITRDDFRCIEHELKDDLR